jgi:ABC-type multidrug transport system fused ATPase/permease subunit
MATRNIKTVVDLIIGVDFPSYAWLPLLLLPRRVTTMIRRRITTPSSWRRMTSGVASLSRTDPSRRLRFSGMRTARTNSLCSLVRLVPLSLALDNHSCSLIHCGTCVLQLTLDISAFIYGKLIDDFTALATGALPRASFRAHIQPLVLAFVGLGCASLVGGAVMSWAWGIAGARQTRRVRQLAFRALLRQDIHFFERESGGTLTARLAGGAAAFQDGVSEKPGQVLMHLTTLVGGFAVAYAREWRLVRQAAWLC